MKAGAELRLQPGLKAKVAIPDHAFEKRIDERYDQRRCAQLRDKACPLGDPAGNDRRNGCSKRQQKEKLHQAVTMIGTERAGRLHEIDAVGYPVAYKEVGQRRHCEVTDDLRQRIHLVFLTHLLREYVACKYCLLGH